MKLKQLIEGIPFTKVHGSKEKEILGISSDSRTIGPGFLFVARRGKKNDGSLFASKAVEAGAIAMVTSLYDPFLPITQLIHPHPERVEPLLAASYYKNPSRDLFVVGVTGTKGKTTTTYLIQHLLKECALMGTIETLIANKRYPSTLTTPDPVFVQRMLREIVSTNLSAAVLESSSIGLEQGRVDGIDFDVAVWTNLMPDHLDYHKTVAEYFQAKKILFQKIDRSLKPHKRAIVNGDDPYASEMTYGLKTEIMTFGMKPGVDIRLSSSGREIDFRGKSVAFKNPLIGTFNSYNILAAIAVSLHQGSSLEEIAARLETFPGVPGRLEKIPNRRGIQTYVDYAHHKESLEQALTTLLALPHKRLIVVFGCGGNRDPQRRTGMASAAERYADAVFVTSDNPRSEDPNEIIRQILSGFSSRSKVELVEPDRKKAIEAALSSAEPGDLVLIAGKGHEKMQIFASQTIPFDDVEVAKQYFERLPQ